MTDNPSERMERTMRDRVPNVQPTLLSYMQRHTGEVKVLNDIASDVGFEARIIQNGMLRLVRKGIGIEVIVQGNAWKYVPQKATDGKPLFEQVGKTKKGVLILESEDGTLYRAVEIE